MKIEDLQDKLSNELYTRYTNIINKLCITPSNIKLQKNNNISFIYKFDDDCYLAVLLTPSNAQAVYEDENHSESVLYNEFELEHLNNFIGKWIVENYR